MPTEEASAGDGGAADFDRDVWCLLGVPLDAIGMSGALERVRRAARERRRLFLSTPNLNFLVTALRDPAFRGSLLRSDLNVADGMPVLWMAKLLGIPIAERVAGSDLFDRLRDGDGGRPLRVFFFGGAEGVAEAACRQINARPGALVCVGHEYPGVGPVEALSRDEFLDRINRSGADFLVVALGARKGQAWIERNLPRLDVPVVSHLGAVINFVAGNVRRAPAWMRRCGLEWLWRIGEEPALWRRYALDGAALVELLLGRLIPLALELRLRSPSRRTNSRRPASRSPIPPARSSCACMVLGRRRTGTG